MSGDIIWESGTFLYALWWGMVLAFQYDTIRIIRRIIKCQVNNNFVVSLPGGAG